MAFIVSVKPSLIKENKKIKVKKNIKKNLGLISSIMMRKLRLRQKNDFPLKKRILPNISRSKGNQTMKFG